MNSGARVSIPNSVRKTIQNIKEITGNHSEDEIYAMLKECSMDPNETTQKLLLQDPFHEVRRKRDRKKENHNKEMTESRWKPGMQGRGNRGGRGNYPSRHIYHDAGSRKNAYSAKENEINKCGNDGVILPAPQDNKNKETSVVASSSNIATDKPSEIVSEKNKNPGLSASGPILIPPFGTVRREIDCQQAPVDQVKETPAEIKTASGSEVGSSLIQGKMFQGEGNNNRPPSGYNNRPHQAIGPQKVGPVKEWKPKPINPIPSQELVTEVSAVQMEDHSSLKSASNLVESKEREESCISDGQHVIIPNHLHVPEIEKLGFRFGSFDATFGINSTSKSPSVSEASEIIEHVEEQSTRNQDVLVAAADNDEDEDDLDRPSSSSNVPENLSPEGDTSSSNVGQQENEPKQETSLPTANHQYPIIHPSSNLNFGFVPPVIGTQIAPFETESQARDASRVPGFVVQQPFDPAGYYPQFYRPGADNDGRISPFHPPGKYNGNIPVSSQQPSQSSQEVGNSLLSGAGPTPLATQAGGPMQSSIAVTQQPLPVFRQPTGLHLPHYPPNYIPYGPYFSPFFIPPPAIHQFLSNGAFPQQPQSGGMYPVPPVGNPKYPVPQYKPASNTGNSGHIGGPGPYGPYGSNPGVTAGNSASNEDLGGSQFKENNVYVTGQQSEGSGVWIATAPGRDISGSFYNLPQGGQVAYTPTQAAHGPFASIYHHPPQPVTTGPIHPLLQQPQTMAGPVDMVGPTSGPYQQQPTQLNWPNNY